MTFVEIRRRYPEYDDLTNAELARALHNRHYSDMTFVDFANRIGFDPSTARKRGISRVDEPMREDGGLLPPRRSKAAQAVKNVFYTAPGRGAGDALIGLASIMHREPQETYEDIRKFLGPFIDLQAKKAGAVTKEQKDKWIKKYLAERRSKAAAKLEERAAVYPEPELQYGGKGVTGIIEEAATGITRYAPSMVLGYAGMLPIYLQEKGRKYQELIDDGVDKETADTASDIHAFTATPVEFMGNLLQLKAAGRVLKSVGTKMGIGQRMQQIIGALIQGGAGEGLEEYTQAHTEVIADVYAEDPKAKPTEIASKVIEIWQSPEFKAASKRAMGIGIVGGMLIPFAGAAVSTPFNAREYLRDKARKEKKEVLEDAYNETAKDEALADRIESDFDLGELNTDQLRELLKTVPPDSKSATVIQDLLAEERGLTTIQPEIVPRKPEESGPVIYGRAPVGGLLAGEQKKLPPPKPKALPPPSPEKGPEGPTQFGKPRRKPIKKPLAPIPLDVISRGLDPDQYKFRELREIADGMGADLKGVKTKQDIVDRIQKKAKEEPDVPKEETIREEEQAQRPEEGREEVKAVHDFSNTQVQLPEPEAKSIREFGNQIPEEEIYTDPEDPSYGREESPHITVRYGLATDDVKDVAPSFEGMGPITAKMGKVSIFETDDYDVVKVDIESEDLREANKRVGETVDLPGETFKDYKPHATIAYVKKGEGKKYVGDKTFEGKTITFDSIILSDRQGNGHEIELKPTPKAKDISEEQAKKLDRESRAAVVSDEGNIYTGQNHEIAYQRLEDAGDTAEADVQIGWIVNGEFYGDQSEAVKALEAKPLKTIPHSKDLDIRNLDALPRGTGARYLEVIEGEEGAYIAKQWRRKPIKSGILIDFEGEVAPKAKEPPEEITLYHSSPEEYKEGKPPFAAYFGDKDWKASFPKEFGEYEYEITLPQNAKILDLDVETGESRSFKDKWGEGKRVDDNEFYSEDWVDKQKILPEIEKLEYDGAKFRGEYLLTEKIIDQSEPIKKKKEFTLSPEVLAEYPELQKKEEPWKTDTKLKPREYQEKYPERTVHEDWDRANSPRYDLEAAGDILREFQKSYSDPGYIGEKLRRVRGLINAKHPDDTIEAAQKHAPEQLNRLISQYESQPTTNENQEIAKAAILALMKDDLEQATRHYDAIEAIISPKEEKPTLSPEAKAGEPGNFIFKTKDGTIHEASPQEAQGIHGIALDVLGINADDVVETGIRDDKGEIQWGDKSQLAKDKKKAKEVEEKPAIIGKAKPQPGEAKIPWKGDKRRISFTEFHEYKSGKHKGKIRVKYHGRNYTIDKGDVLRWPTTEPPTVEKKKPTEKDIIGTFEKKQKNTFGEWTKKTVPVLSLSEPINIRGKVTGSNWMVEYDTFSEGKTGRQTNKEYFAKKVDAQKWIDEIGKPTPVVEKKIPAKPKRTARSPRDFRDWIRLTGGVNSRDPDYGTDLKEMAYTTDSKGKKKLDKGFGFGFFSKKALGFDEKVLQAIEWGWLPDGATEQDLLDLIQRNPKEPPTRVEDNLDKYTKDQVKLELERRGYEPEAIEEYDRSGTLPPLETEERAGEEREGREEPEIKRYSSLNEASEDYEIISDHESLNEAEFIASEGDVILDIDGGIFLGKPLEKPAEEKPPLSDRIKELRREGHELALRLEEIGRDTDADNIKRSIELFTKRQDLTMMEGTVENAKTILKTFAPAEDRSPLVLTPSEPVSKEEEIAIRRMKGEIKAPEKETVKWVNETDNFGDPITRLEGTDWKIREEPKGKMRKRFTVLKGDGAEQEAIDRFPDLSSAKGAILEETGMKKVVIPDEKIKPGTSGEQRGLFGTQKGESKSLFDKLKDEEGSIDNEHDLYPDLVRVARNFYNETRGKFIDFHARMKEIFSDVWDKIRPIIKNLWADAKAKITEETGAIETGDFTREILSRMNRTLKAKGYDVRGADDVKTLLDKNRVFKNGKFTHPGWQEAYDKAVQSVSKRKATQKEKKAKKSQFKNINWERLRELGKTGDIKEAGYIAPDGSYLDFSGKREGGQPGDRSYDHREAGGTDGMQELMAYGYIRMDANSGAIDITREPTKQQYDRIRILSNLHRGEIVLDLEDGLGEYDESNGYYRSPQRTFSREYNKGTNSQRIINDVKKFFAGEMPVTSAQDSMIARFRDETGAIDVNHDLYPDLQRVARNVYAQGHQTFSAFSKEMKRIFADVWDRIRRVIKQLWQDAKRKITEETGAFSGELAIRTPEQRTVFDQALEMERQGKDASPGGEIWKETGWFLNPYDRKWRYEIDDSQMKFKLGIPLSEAIYLEELISHKQLFDAYPDIRNVRVQFEVDNTISGNHGFFGTHPETGISTIRIFAKDLDSAKSTLIHEIQHAIQELEGFARGGSHETVYKGMERSQLIQEVYKEFRANPHLKDLSNKEIADKAREYVDSYGGRYETYHRLAGEIEAREASDRMDLTAEQRREQAPFKDGIPADQAIVRFHGQEALQAQAEKIKGEKAFKKWFGDSKVVDENGEPLVVYHGMKGPLEGGEFDLSRLGESTKARSAKEGMFFAKDPVTAGTFARFIAISPIQKKIESIQSEMRKISGIEKRYWTLMGKGKGDSVNLRERISKTQDRHRQLQNEMGKIVAEYTGKDVDSLSSLDYMAVGNLDYTGANIIPAYINLENPHVIDLKGNEPTKGRLMKAIGEAKKQGNDGVIFRNSFEPGEKPTDVYMVFEPTQIKSIFNVGTWSPTDPNISMSQDSWAETYLKNAMEEHKKRQKEGNPFGGSGDPPNTDKARETLNRHFRDFMYWVVDKNYPINTIQKRLTKISENIDLFMSETQRPKVTAAKVKAVWDDEVVPMLGFMAKNYIDIADLEEYSHAKHAPEANQALRLANSKRYYQSGRDILTKRQKRNLSEDVKEKLGLDSITELKSPEDYNVALETMWDMYGDIEKMAGLKKSWDVFSERPSGMSDQESKDILNAYKGDETIEVARQMLSSINENKLDTLYDAGLLAEEEYRNIKNKYKYYVPLYREGYADTPQGSGRGLMPAGRPVKTRMGSTRDVVNIVANSISNYENAINRSEKARSARVFYNLIKANPDPDLWSIGEVSKSPRHDRYGNIQIYPDLFNVAPNEMRIMIDGKQHLIEVNKNNKDMMLMLKTLKAEDSMSGPYVNALFKVNKWLSRVNTSYSPEFILSNFVRDIQTAGINIQDTGVESKKIFRGALQSAKAIYNVERGQGTGAHLEQMYDRFKKAGGKIGWNDIHGSIENLSKKVTKELDMIAGKRPIRKGMVELVRWIENANTAVENGVRLHAFTLAVEQGMSDKKAANIASDLTVDFTRKGAAGPAINSLYLFANAGIQGSYRLFRAGIKSPKVRGIMGGIVGAGFVVSLMNSVMGGEDDDGEDYYNKIDDFVRERNMIFMLPGTKGRYVKIPSPWGYNFFWNIGDEIGKVFTKERYSPMAGAGRVASVFVGAFNPIQSGTLLQTLSPTILDPFAQVAENKNWFGGDLMPERNIFDKTPDPDSQRYWKSASIPSKWVASQLNSLTGGSKIRPGLIDVSPETLDLMIDTAGGSMLRFWKDIAGTPGRLIRKEETQMYQIPFLRRIAGKKSEWADSRQYRKNIEDIFYLKEELETYQGTREYHRLLNALGKKKDLILFAKMSERRLRKLRKRKKRYEKKGDKDTVRKIEAQMKQVYMKFNEKYNSVMTTEYKKAVNQ